MGTMAPISPDRSTPAALALVLRVSVTYNTEPGRIRGRFRTTRGGPVGRSRPGGEVPAWPLIPPAAR